MTPENLPGLRITADQLGAIWTPPSEPPRLSALGGSVPAAPIKSTEKIAA